VICPSGGSLTGLSGLISDFPKDIFVPTYPKSILELFASHPTRGAYRDRHGSGEGCGGRGSVLRATKGRGVLDTPLEPVIGLAEGETRWRSMTASARRGLCAVTSEGSDEAIHSFLAALWIRWRSQRRLGLRLFDNRISFDELPSAQD
jgi:hypothetical protein